MILIIIFVFLVGATILFGPPVLPTLKKQVNAALDELNLKKGQTLLDLGSGTGSVVSQARKRNLKAIGVELHPFWYLFSRLRFLRDKNVRIIYGNYFKIHLPDTDGIYVFTTVKFADKLSEVIAKRYKKKYNIVSYSAELKGLKHKRVSGPFFVYKQG